MKKLASYKKDSKILIVEDDNITRNKIVEILSRHYSNIIEAKNGKEALEKFQKAFLVDENFDLIISDINMPFVNGIDLLESIREVDDTVPFIFITAKTDLEYILHVIKLDINDYIVKPVDLTSLLLSIDNCLKKSYKKEFKKSKTSVISLENDFYWDNSRKALYLENEVLKLTKNEIQFLDILCNQVNQIVNMDYIIYEIWTDRLDMYSAQSNLKNLISRLRYKYATLEIENIYGLGYRIKENR